MKKYVVTLTDEERQLLEQLLANKHTAALKPKPVPRTPRKVDGTVAAHLIALACSDPPQGRQRWTLRLLADKLVELELVDSISHEEVRQVLKKTS